MAGLLNLIPRYLPRFGMAPEWAKASRPLVLVFMGVAFAVTFLFRANVDAQGGAYATGVLVLITSAAFAVTIAAWHTAWKWPFLFIALVFVYTTVLNVYERPEGIKIASFFIASIIATSLISRALRSTELRICDVDLDDTAKQMLAEDEDQVIRLIARRPRVETAEALDQIDQEVRYFHSLSADERLYFFEVERGDASEFEETLHVSGERRGQSCGPARQEPCDCECNRGDAHPSGEDHGPDAPRILQVDRGSSHGQHVSLPLLRRGRRCAHCAGSAAPRDPRSQASSHRSRKLVPWCESPSASTSRSTCFNRVD